MSRERGERIVSPEMEGVLAAAFVASLAFRLRDEVALVDGLRALTDAVERYRRAIDAEDEVDEEDGRETVAAE